MHWLTDTRHWKDKQLWKCVCVFYTSNSDTLACTELVRSRRSCWFWVSLNLSVSWRVSQTAVSEQEDEMRPNALFLSLLQNRHTWKSILWTFTLSQVALLYYLHLRHETKKKNRKHCLGAKGEKKARKLCWAMSLCLSLLVSSFYHTHTHTAELQDLWIQHKTLPPTRASVYRVIFSAISVCLSESVRRQLNQAPPREQKSDGWKNNGKEEGG